MGIHVDQSVAQNLETVNFSNKVAHIAGYVNILADNLLRIRIRPSDSSLNDLVLENIFLQWEKLIIYLFASGQIHKIPILWTWRPHPKAIAIDALSISWKRLIAYAFLPICLFPKVLEHIKQFIYSQHHSGHDGRGTPSYFKWQYPVKFSCQCKTIFCINPEPRLFIQIKKSSLNSLVSVNSHFKTKGFSENARKLLTASWGHTKRLC